MKNETLDLINAAKIGLKALEIIVQFLTFGTLLLDDELI